MAARTLEKDVEPAAGSFPDGHGEPDTRVRARSSRGQVARVDGGVGRVVCLVDVGDEVGGLAVGGGEGGEEGRAEASLACAGLAYG